MGRNQSFRLTARPLTRTKIIQLHLLGKGGGKRERTNRKKRESNSLSTQEAFTTPLEKIKMGGKGAREGSALTLHERRRRERQEFLPRKKKIKRG